MRSKFFLFFISACFYTLGCDFTGTRFTGKAYVDERFVGTWRGSSSHEDKGFKKSWVQVRDNNGNYRINFKVYSIKNEPYWEKEESGKWWVKDNLFYEQEPKLMTNPDVYKYEFISYDEVKFIAISLETNTEAVEGYTFTDKRVR